MTYSIYQALLCGPCRGAHPSW